MGKTFAAMVWVAAVMAGMPALAEGNEARGERLFNQQCKTCHTVDKGGASPSGPNLNGLFGRKAGSGGGYESSDAMKNSGITWDEAALAEYLKNPKAKVAGTKMVFGGIRQDAQLQDVIAYLKKATQ